MEPAPRAGSEALRGGWAAARAAGLLSSSAPGLRASLCPSGGAAGRRQVREPERAPRPLPAPLPPGRLRGRAGWRSRERAVQRAAAPSPPGFPSPLARPPLSAPLRACSRISGTRLARPLARSLRPPLSPPRPPPPPTRRPEGTLPASPGRAHAPPKPITGRPGGRAAGRGVAGLCPHAHPTPGRASGAVGIARPRGWSAPAGGGCGLGLPS